MKERRKLQRFEIELLAKVELLEPEEKRTLKLMTNNISAKGVHFRMLGPISKNTRVRTTIIFASQTIIDFTGYQGVLKVEGTVVRTEKTGIAIVFDKAYKIERVLAGEYQL